MLFKTPEKNSRLGFYHITSWSFTDVAQSEQFGWTAFNLKIIDTQKYKNIFKLKSMKQSLQK